MNLNYLYREIIMDHYQNPRNKGLLNNKNYQLVSLYNPSCGDEVTIQFLLEGKTIKDIRQEGKGCSICCASASLMSETLKGKQTEKALEIIESFANFLMGEKDENINREMLAFEGVGKFPARIRCAMLAWKALEKGLKEGVNNG
ncbi:MAG: SUF system NifU family Fe-S cluster assembly protein [Acholeplasmatales bacterium]|jgi:nitrogen fixation NifU-like protein|nr:SUF system NifU family Fe-S cluster assembly protein [Acholeplasmataceae bacterium]MDY0115535.1 SUF system NifU family Fe-S cluster assembly protein [Acholeplasmatales bacterium]MCK9234009.1 SUF system NifU family Fe-S cluster assembly protein [Acholeplasmataceae bacterium]MCK9289055.1 SUF system NifU family Fe-S cluster assembly protein [Acholeplasmataceae bacterium]MCK9427750.1 SUF system NifU family Fe-S cluster assembly protein [Acholeplasmataceae bacterium]